MICNVCHHFCDLSENQIGKCLVRQCSGGTVRPIHYGECSILAVEPIEKRPLFHFSPGSKYLSVGFYGCPFQCGFCLTGDTLISAPSGLKRIDQILEGDEIYAFDNSTGVPQCVIARVGHVFDREVEEVIELEVDGQTIQLTGEHPVMTRRGWVKAVNLTEDDEVLCDKTYLEQFHSLFQNGD